QHGPRSTRAPRPSGAPRPRPVRNAHACTDPVPRGRRPALRAPGGSRAADERRGGGPRARRRATAGTTPGDAGTWRRDLRSALPGRPTVPSREDRFEPGEEPDRPGGGEALTHALQAARPIAPDAPAGGDAVAPRGADIRQERGDDEAPEHRDFIRQSPCQPHASISREDTEPPVA